MKILIKKFFIFISYIFFSLFLFFIQKLITADIHVLLIFTRLVDKTFGIKFFIDVYKPFLKKSPIYLFNSELYVEFLKLEINFTDLFVNFIKNVKLIHIKLISKIFNYVYMYLKTFYFINFFSFRYSIDIYSIILKEMYLKLKKFINNIYLRHKNFVYKNPKIKKLFFTLKPTTLKINKFNKLVVNKFNKLVVNKFNKLVVNKFRYVIMYNRKVYFTKFKLFYYTLLQINIKKIFKYKNIKKIFKYKNIKKIFKHLNSILIRIFKHLNSILIRIFKLMINKNIYITLLTFNINILIKLLKWLVKIVYIIFKFIIKNTSIQSFLIKKKNEYLNSKSIFKLIYLLYKDFIVIPIVFILRVFKLIKYIYRLIKRTLKKIILYVFTTFWRTLKKVIYIIFKAIAYSSIVWRIYIRAVRYLGYFLPRFYIFWEELEDAWQCILDGDLYSAVCAIKEGIVLSTKNIKIVWPTSKLWTFFFKFFVYFTKNTYEFTYMFTKGTLLTKRTITFEETTLCLINFIITKIVTFPLQWCLEYLIRIQIIPEIYFTFWRNYWPAFYKTAEDTVISIFIEQFLKYDISYLDIDIESDLRRWKFLLLEDEFNFYKNLDDTDEVYENPMDYFDPDNIFRVKKKNLDDDEEDVEKDEILTDKKANVKPEKDEILTDKKANVKPEKDEILTDKKANVKPEKDEILTDKKANVKPEKDEILTDKKANVKPEKDEILTDKKANVKPEKAHWADVDLFDETEFFDLEKIAKKEEEGLKKIFFRLKDYENLNTYNSRKTLLLSWIISLFTNLVNWNFIYNLLRKLHIYKIFNLFVYRKFEKLEDYMDFCNLMDCNSFEDEDDNLTLLPKIERITIKETDLKSRG